MSVAYQGAPGAFGHEACLAFLPEHEPVARPTFSAVIAAVEAGEADFGVLPLENNRAGPVPNAKAMIAASSLATIAERTLPIRIHLLALPGVAVEELESVSSHPMALKQCVRSIGEMGLRIEPAANTALAALNLADRSRAVLASESAAQAYGLTILKRDMQDWPDNATRFALLGRRDG
jgi:prephenate dehydratase